MTAAFEPDDLLPAEPSPESPSEASPLPSGEPWAEGALESGFDEGAEEDALADEGDHDGETVISSRAQELREQISGESEEESPAMVLALLCHYGHINPPHGSSCRLCGAPIGGEPNWYPRPALGEIYVSTGLRVPIDADIIIGRKPTSTPESGRPHAHLVPVPSPDQQISRTHCEVRVDGWDVRLVDRNSNNGTYVLRPGERPIRIRPTEPFFVRVGDVIDIGEGVTIQMLGPQAGV
jgi:putative FHA domain protein